MDAWQRVSAHDPVARLADALNELAGVPVALERPADAEHGDYATNVALKLAGLQQRPPRDIAAELAAQAVEAGIARGRRPPDPGSSTSGSRMPGSPRASVRSRT